jgi:hypothetical protein
MVGTFPRRRVARLRNGSHRGASSLNGTTPAVIKFQQRLELRSPHQEETMSSTTIEVEVLRSPRPEELGFDAEATASMAGALEDVCRALKVGGTSKSARY